MLRFVVVGHLPWVNDLTPLQHTQQRHPSNRTQWPKQLNPRAATTSQMTKTHTRATISQRPKPPKRTRAPTTSHRPKTPKRTRAPTTFHRPKTPSKGPQQPHPSNRLNGQNSYSPECPQPPKEPKHPHGPQKPHPYKRPQWAKQLQPRTPTTSGPKSCKSPNNHSNQNAYKNITTQTPTTRPITATSITTLHNSYN